MYEEHPLTVVGIEQLADGEAAVLHLQDDLGRPLSIPVGLCEMVPVQLVLQNTPVSRPMSHDLLRSLIEQLDASLVHVVIDDYSKGTFYARLILNTNDGRISMDCRPSDGIALALRTRVPILATEPVMQQEEHE